MIWFKAMKSRKNCYVKSSQLSEAKFRELVKYFSADLTATQIAQLSNINRNTINRYLRLIRHRIVEQSEAQCSFFGVVEVDESWFGARRVKGKRGRGAFGKTTVFGIYERQGQVYTEIVPNCSKVTLQGIIRGKVNIDSVVNSDGWRGYNGLVDIGYGHFRVEHSRDEFARGPVHINGIEGFWGYAKVRLAKFRGMHPQTFLLHLKETEFRYNMRNKNIGRHILKICRKNPLN